MFGLALAPMLAKFLSPRVLLGIFVAILIGAVFFVGYKAINNFIILEKQSVSLQQNVTTLQNDLTQEQQNAKTQEKLQQVNLNAVQNKDTAQQLELSQLQSDQQALQALGTPTNEDFKCSSSPYITTVLDRLRARASSNSNDSDSSKTGNAVTSK